MFFVQETSLSILYIHQTRKFLRDTVPLQNSLLNSSTSARRPAAAAADKRVLPMLHQLIYTNLLVIALDAALLGIQYADLFYLQGAFKPCVYGIKLKAEFVILNRLVRSVRARGELGSHGSNGNGNGNFAGPGGVCATPGSGERRRSWWWWSRLVVGTSGGPQLRHSREEVRVDLVSLDGEAAACRPHSHGSEVSINCNREAII